MSDHAAAATSQPHDHSDQATSRERVLCVSGLSRLYGNADALVHALRGVSFAINEPAMIALLGRSGSGKSTLLQLLGAVDRPTSGEVQVGGRSISSLTEHELARFRRRHLGFVFQSFELVDSLSVFDNVALPWMLDRDFDADKRDQTRQILERLGVAELAKRFPDQLSGGQQQRVALARAIVRRPSLVLADEPTGNLDRKTGDEVLDLLAELQQEMRLTIVMATHDERAAARCAGRIEIEDGNITALEGACLSRDVTP